MTYGCLRYLVSTCCLLMVSACDLSREQPSDIQKNIKSRPVPAENGQPESTPADAPDTQHVQETQ